MSKDLYLDFLAGLSEGFIHSGGEAATELLAEHLNVEPGEKVMEIGCGTGTTLVKLITHYPRAQFYACDGSENMLIKTSSRLRFCGLAGKVELKKTNDAASAFPNVIFDKIYIESVLGILGKEQLEDMITSIKKILKPGGMLIINETMWKDGTEISQIESINSFCIEKFGIAQASSYLPYLKDWISFLNSNNFKEEQVIRLQAMNSVKRATKGPELLSRVFTWKGKMAYRLNPKALSRAKKFDLAILELKYSQPLLIHYLIKCKKN